LSGNTAECASAQASVLGKMAFLSMLFQNQDKMTQVNSILIAIQLLTSSPLPPVGTREQELSEHGYRMEQPLPISCLVMKAQVQVPAWHSHGHHSSKMEGPASY